MTEARVDAGQTVKQQQTRYSTEIDVKQPEPTGCPLDWFTIRHGPEEGGDVFIDVQGEKTTTLKPGSRISFADMSGRWYSVDHVASPTSF